MAWRATAADSRSPGVDRSWALQVLPDRLAVARLEPDADWPTWSLGAGRFLSITRTKDELSIVCREEAVPAGVTSEGGWRALVVDGPLDFSEVGVLAALTDALAHEGVSIFAISTYDTDYLLVRAPDLERAIEALRARGHRVQNLSDRVI